MSGFGYDVGLDAAGMPDLVERLESRRVLVTGASGLLGSVPVGGGGGAAFSSPAP